MKEIIIKILNPVVSQFSGDPEILKPILSYNEEIFIPKFMKGHTVKIRKVNKKYLISKTGMFLTGLIPRVKEYLDYKKIKYKTTGIHEDKIKIIEPKLKGIILRDNQKENIKKLLENKRGLHVEPTGGGKTVLGGGLISSIKEPSLFIVHTTALFDQTYKEFCNFFGKNKVGRIGAGIKDIKQYNVAMIQTLKNVKLDKNQFGMIICDECHHSANLNGIYAKVFDKIHAPYRFGLTATPPTEEGQKLILEGLIGKVINKIEFEDHIEAGILAKPKLKLIMAPENKKIKTMRGTYLERYDLGIVKFKGRNALIMQETLNQINKGNTVLILVERIEHGKELMKFANILIGKNRGIFLHGKSNKEIKEQLRKTKKKWLRLEEEKSEVTLDLTPTFDKKKFNEKVRKVKDKFEGLSESAKENFIESMRQKFEKRELPFVIATRVWVEGVNVKSVNCIINAVGGQSEKAVIQKFGRGMRTTEDKKEVTLIDVIDAETHNDFMRHSMKRICYYYDKKWLGN
ncbi:DEAD/DEAH box helicase family protein [Candidatus Gracilibacteria bacterium]|jgi:superfamily II DNA or RNA helicase|nr:DEAD/DEAH box helicase family protein [Candidatus Gracilibacteria bacterium]